MFFEGFQTYFLSLFFCLLAKKYHEEISWFVLFKSWSLWFCKFLNYYNEIWIVEGISWNNSFSQLLIWTFFCLELCVFSVIVFVLTTCYTTNLLSHSISLSLYLSLTLLSLSLYIYIIYLSFLSICLLFFFSSIYLLSFLLSHSLMFSPFSLYTISFFSLSLSLYISLLLLPSFSNSISFFYTFFSLSSRGYMINFCLYRSSLVIHN